MKNKTGRKKTVVLICKDKKAIPVDLIQSNENYFSQAYTNSARLKNEKQYHVLLNNQKYNTWHN